MSRSIPRTEAGFYQINELWMYPWDQWMNGDVWELDPQTDFPSTDVKRFRNQVYYVARHFEYEIRTRVRDGKLIIQAQLD